MSALSIKKLDLSFYYRPFTADCQQRRTVEREYGLGRLRTDLLVLWPTPKEMQKVVIELKLLRKSLEQTIEQGLAQTVEYLDRTGTTEGHLVIFDRSVGKFWEEKLFSAKNANIRGIASLFGDVEDMQKTSLP